jgi:predicted dehydrogenase
MQCQMFTRRSFLKTSFVAAAACSLSPRSWASVPGANEDVRIAIVGLNGRGQAHLEEGYNKIKGVRIVALCDVDTEVLAKRAGSAEGAQKYADFRKLLESKEIDAVSIATPNHWHSLQTIWACQAGKDVYVEKPCSHNVFEGRKCVEAARKYNRIVQHGSQSRSNALAASAEAIVKSGKYGKLLVAKGYCCKPRWSIGSKPISEPPANLDFDTWLGPAPKQPFHANLVHYNWHWFWDFGNGDIGNQGVHEVDVARWGLGGTFPKSVVSLGGRYVNEPDFKDQGQTPNQLVSVFDFGGPLLLFETRGLVENKSIPGFSEKYPRQVANEFYFEEGAIKRWKFFPKGKGEGEPLVKVDYAAPKTNDHFANFITAVRSRKHEDLTADILEGHISSALCHLGNISYRLAKKQKFEKPRDFSDNAIVGDSVMATLENTKAIGLDPEKATLWVGPKLQFDPDKEKFVNNSAANKMLTREYRKPFVVPEKV